MYLCAAHNLANSDDRETEEQERCESILSYQYVQMEIVEIVHGHCFLKCQGTPILNMTSSVITKPSLL